MLNSGGRAERIGHHIDCRDSRACLSVGQPEEETMTDNAFGIRDGRGRRRAAGEVRRRPLLSSAGCARRGRGASSARRTPASPMPSARSRSIRALPRRSTGVETCTHLLVLYWMDHSRRDLVLQARGTTANCAAPLRCARRRGRTRSRRAWCDSSRSTATKLVGRRPRLPRRHAAPRHQAVLRLDRFGAGRRRRMAQGAQGVRQSRGHVLVFFASRLTKDCKSSGEGGSRSSI